MDLLQVAHNPVLVACLQWEIITSWNTWESSTKKNPDTFLAIFKHCKGKWLEEES